MSQIETIKVNCPKCHTAQDYKVFRTINKERREELLNFKIFEFSCCGCDLKSKLFYPTLYHDQENKFMIQYTKDKDTSKYEETFSGINYLNSEYTYRIVNNQYLMIEKVLILENKYDDRVIEILKEFQIAAMNNNQVDMLLFAKDKSGKFCFVAIDSNMASLGTLPLNENLYKMIYDKFYDKIADDKNLVIDQDWAQKILNEVNI